MDALAEVGPGHFLGCAQPTRTPRMLLALGAALDYKPFETWSEEGGRGTQALASARVAKLIADYRQPPLDPEIAGRLEDYVARRKSEMRDAFS